MLFVWLNVGLLWHVITTLHITFVISHWRCPNVFTTFLKCSSEYAATSIGRSPSLETMVQHRDLQAWMVAMEILDSPDTKFILLDSASSKKSINQCSLAPAQLQEHPEADATCYPGFWFVCFFNGISTFYGSYL